MTTLVEIPSCTALHVPTPTSSPLPLATGELTLVLIPANPPAHPSPTLTLSVGSAAFPLLPNSPVQKVKAKEEHASYQFTPVPADGGMAVGTVRIQMRDSKNQGEWEATEALCAKLEGELKSHGVWDEKTLFVNDEFEASGEPVKGWGETVAGTLLGGAAALAGKIAHFTESHIGPQTAEPKTVNPVTADKVSALPHSTATLADNAEVSATKIGENIVAAGKRPGADSPGSIAKPSEALHPMDKGEFRKAAEAGWEQVTIAAKGMAEAVTTVGKSVTENAHKAIENQSGKQADQAAQDAGQTGSDMGNAAIPAVKGTSGVVHGDTATSGTTTAKSS